jgi:general secretion pathway protein D
MNTKPIYALLLALCIAGCSSLSAEDKESQLFSSHRNASPDPAPATATQVDSADDRAKPMLFEGNNAMIDSFAARQKAAAKGEPVTLSFEQAPIAEVVHSVLGDLLKVDYSIVTPISGEITLRTRGPIPRANVIPLLESALQANGVALVADASGHYRVGSADALKSAPRGVTTAQTLPSGSGSVVVNLQYVGATEMADILRPIAGQEALQRVDTTRNLLMLSGTRSQIDGWLEIVRTFDVDFLQGMSVGMFPLTHTSAREVEAALQTLIGKADQGAASGQNAADPAAPPGRLSAPMPMSMPMGVPSAPPAQGRDSDNASTSTLQGLIRILPIERLNALMVVTPRAHYLDMVKVWINRLDRPADGNGGSQLWIYPVQNGSAEHLANLLNSLYGNGDAITPATSNGIAPGMAQTSRFMNNNNNSNASNRVGGNASFGMGMGLGMGMMGAGGAITQISLGDNVRIVADPNKNALLIYASKRDYLRIEDALRRLDSSPTQVMIEASIVEVALADDLKYGLQWYFQGQHGSRSDQGGLTGNTINPSGAYNNGLSVIPNAVASASGFAYSLLNSAGDIRVMLNALAEKQLVNMLSNPNVLVLDNQTASINVGDQQPVKTGSSATDSGVISESISYRDTGVTLIVKPSVNAGDMVTLDVDQSVTEVGGQDVATGQRAFSTRQIISKVAVRSGETIVLGGLIRDNKIRTKSGVPLLQDIPYLGGLFRSSGETTSRTELIVMLTPRVIRTGQDARQIGAELRDRMIGLQKLRGAAKGHVDRLARPSAAAVEQ